MSQNLVIVSPYGAVAVAAPAIAEHRAATSGLLGPGLAQWRRGRAGGGRHGRGR
ncbi:hypothetical protein HMPREF0731_0053, partial [Pseudoroseomonas cervicalis ATCC 49957]